jgi:ABC-type transport system substrate-binding protein
MSARSTPAAVALLAALAMLTASSSTGARRPDRTAANVVVFGLEADAGAGFNIALACCNSLQAEQMGAYEALRGAFVQNAKGAWVKDLVAAATADTHGVSYTIRPHAYWYWGGRRLPVTYRDFVYTLQQIDNPRNDVSGRAGYSNLDAARFIHHGDRRVTFFWRRTNCSTDFPCGPYADWQSIFSQLYPAAALAGLDFNKIWTTCICGFDGKPVADGPFYLVRYTPGQGSVLRANPFFHTHAKLREIDFKVIPDPALLAEAMRSGQVDAISPPFTTDLPALRGLPGITYRIAPVDSLEHIELRLGSERGGPGVTKPGSNALLRAPWMRQAIALALDRPSMIDAVYGPDTGLEPVNSFLFYPGQAAYRPDFARWNYNPAAAIALLGRHCTGGPTAPDPTTTKVWHCSGLPALFRYSWPADAPARTAIEQVANRNLKAVGIALDDRPLPSSLFFGADGVASGDFDLSQFAWFTSGDAGDWSEEYRCFGLDNWTGYCSHKVDNLLRAANSELNPAAREGLFERADAIMALEVPTIPLFQKFGVLIYKSGLLGLGPNSGTFSYFWNVEDWRWAR